MGTEGSKGRERRWPLRAIALVCALVAAGATPALAKSAIRFFPCYGNSGVRCGTVAAPLDYSGRTPGELPLAVEELPARGVARGIMFLVAGGPGQASAKVFDLATNGALWQLFFPGYTLVAYDDRGTGASGPLACPGLLAATPGSDDNEIAALVGACGASLGPSRVFYSTRDHAEDIETVRAALGAGQIALWGTSYGTKQVIAYALAHPTRVQRLLLDSVLPPQGPDAFASDTLQAIPLGVESLCGDGACRSASLNPVGDVVSLANQLAARPIVQSFKLPGPPPVAVRVDGVALLSLVRDTDLNPGVAAELPAAVSAALAGRPVPLARLWLLDNLDSGAGPSSEYDAALGLTTICDDGLFPWEPDSPVAQRQTAVDAAVAALPAGATGSFGSWAVGLGTYGICKSWPSPAGRASLATGPLPDVPVLVLSGDRDMRTPTAGARAVAAGFPRAQVLVVPGAGHSVLTTDFSLCALHGVWAWLDGKQPSSCRRIPLLFAPLARLPASVAASAPTGGVGGARGRTLAAVETTVREAEAAWLTSGRPLTGLAGGRLTPLSDTSFSLAGYSDLPGLALSGSLALVRNGSPLGALVGKLSVSGSQAAHGTLSVHGTVLSGTLAHKRVSAK